eukprot:jgi/Tetstr1/422585/TSEL_013392.t1
MATLLGPHYCLGEVLTLAQHDEDGCFDRNGRRSAKVMMRRFEDEVLLPTLLTLSKHIESEEAATAAAAERSPALDDKRLEVSLLQAGKAHASHAFKAGGGGGSNANTNTDTDTKNDKTARRGRGRSARTVTARRRAAKLHTGRRAGKDAPETEEEETD